MSLTQPLAHYLDDPRGDIFICFELKKMLVKLRNQQQTTGHSKKEKKNFKITFKLKNKKTTLEPAIAAIHGPHSLVWFGD